jgi:hypothetical protein
MFCLELQDGLVIKLTPEKGDSTCRFSQPATSFATITYRRTGVVTDLNIGRRKILPSSFTPSVSVEEHCTIDRLTCC